MITEAQARMLAEAILDKLGSRFRPQAEATQGPRSVVAPAVENPVPRAGRSGIGARDAGGGTTGKRETQSAPAEGLTALAAELFDAKSTGMATVHSGGTGGSTKGTVSPFVRDSAKGGARMGLNSTPASVQAPKKPGIVTAAYVGSQVGELKMRLGTKPKKPVVIKSTEKKADMGKEHERRYILNALPPSAKKGSKIKQGIMVKSQKGYSRIREQDGKYTMTAKYFPLHHEAETEISKEIFDTLWPKVQDQQIKTRYKISTPDKNEWIVDEFEDGKVIAEVEMPRKNGKVSIPDDFDVKTAYPYN